MDLQDRNWLEIILVVFVPGLLAILLHEISHGLMALYLGDTTARDARRLSLNPLRHIDIFGTLLLPGLLLLVHSPFVFGWAKPVPVNFQRLRKGRWGTFLVALAGPFSNLLMLAVWYGIGFFLGTHVQSLMLSDKTVSLIRDASDFGFIINLALILFNLIPIPPLDGGRIVGSLLPDSLRRPYMRLERFGILILILLLATGALRHVLEPVLDFFLSRL